MYQGVIPKNGIAPFTCTHFDSNYFGSLEGNVVVSNWVNEAKYSFWCNKFCFEGIQRGGTVAISTNGCIRTKEDRRYFKQGLEEMISVLKPETIVNYSYAPDELFQPCKKADVELIVIENYCKTVRKKAKA